MKRGLFLTTSLVALSLFSTSAAFAQSSAPGQASVETVEVTGTRISRPGYTSPTPLTALSAQDLTNANPGSPVDALRQLPILSNSTGPRGATGSGGSGGQFLNLRGLGGNNTLVLLDGNRFVPTTSDSTVDISMFPTALFSRTDIVTGGASAAYGSDAVTGVVNFILNRDYTGFKASAQGGVSTFGDDRETKFSAAAGSAFGNGHGHILLSGEFFDSKGIYSLIDRPLGQKSCNAISLPATTPVTPNATTRFLTCGIRNSQANFTGIVNSAVDTTGKTVNNVFRVSDPTTKVPLTALTFDNAGNPAVFHYGTQVSNTTMVGGDGIIPSFLPGEVPLRRNVYYGRVSWDFGAFSSYLEANVGTSNTEYQIGSYDQNLVGNGGVQGTAIAIQADNAYLPASVKTAMTTGKLATLFVSKYFANLPRTWIENRNTTSRVVLGFNGKVFGDWSWDAHFEHGANWQSLNALWDEDLNHMALATDAVVNPANGEIVCRVQLTDAANPCVPYNPLGSSGLAAPDDGQGFNGASNAQLNYVTGTTWQHTRIMEDDMAINLTGEPFSLWAGPVSIAAGGEWRGEGLRNSVDPYGANTPSTLGQAGPFRVGNYHAGNGSFTVIEGYLETVVPLLRDIPFAQSVDFSGAVREASYSNAGTATTWKVGLTWDVTDEVRFRGTLSHDSRAPNLTELYAGVSSGHASITDFTHAGNPVSPQALTLSSGNPNLTSQTGETTTFGVVYQPGWLSGLQVSADFYHIGISNAIQGLGAQNIVQLCAQGVTQLCPLLGYTNGVLSSVTVTPQNIQSLASTGVDFESSYNLQLADVTDMVDGDVTFHALANYVSKFLTVSPGAAVFNTAGQDSRPQWRWTTQMTYHNGPWKFFVQARYSGDGWFDKSTSVPSATGVVDLPQYKVPGQIPVDTNISYDIPTGTGTTQLFLNITDVFNDQPPPFSSVGNYDPIGRFYRAGVRISF